MVVKALEEIQDVAHSRISGNPHGHRSQSIGFTGSMKQKQIKFDPFAPKKVG